MFCGKCGKEIPNGTKFCGNCGAEQAAAKTTPTARAAAPRSAMSSPKAAALSSLNRTILLVPALNLIGLLLSLSKGYHIYNDDYSMYKVWDGVVRVSGYASRSDQQVVKAFGVFCGILIIVAVIFFIRSLVAAMTKPGKKVMVMAAVSSCFMAIPQCLAIVIVKKTIDQVDRYSFNLASSVFGINGIAHFSAIFAVICAIGFIVAAIGAKSNKNTAARQ